MTREWVRNPAKPPSRDEAVHELAARIAHKLGNLLQVVSGNLELVTQRTTDEITLRYLANARSAAEQMTMLARSLPTEPPD